MAESDIYANPQRLISLADDLRKFTATIRSECEKLNGGLSNLGATWKDEEYKKFKRRFDALENKLEKLDHEIRRREPELKEDAQLLRNYLNKSTG